MRTKNCCYNTIFYSVKRGTKRCYSMEYISTTHLIGSGTDMIDWGWSAKCDGLTQLGGGGACMECKG